MIARHWPERMGKFLLIKSREICASVIFLTARHGARAYFSERWAISGAQEQADAAPAIIFGWAALCFERS